MVLKNFRQLRVLRILTVIKTSESMTIIIHAIYKIIPSLINLVLIVVFVILITSINTMARWKGTFYSCDMLPDNPNFIYLSQVVTKNDCLTYQGIWNNKNMNFDNIPNSCLLFFCLIVGSEWMGILYSTIDSIGIDKQPIYNYNPYNILLFYFFILFGSILLFNLFIGIVIDNFNQMKEIVGGYLLLTSQQREWVDLQRFILRKKLKIMITIPKNEIRKILYDIVNNKYFEAFVFFIIVLNFSILISVSGSITQQHENLIFAMNLIVLILYNVEMSIKFIAFGLFFFKDSWNL